MERIKIEATRDKPEIILDAVECSMKIEGASYPENAVPTYSVVIGWLQDNVDIFSKTLVCEFYFTYINSASKKAVFELLIALNKLIKKGHEVSIIWKYDRFDEDMYDMGSEFIEMAKLKGEFIAVDTQ